VLLLTLTVRVAPCHTPAGRGRATLLPDATAPLRLPDATALLRLADESVMRCCSPDDASLHLSPVLAGRPWSHRQGPGLFLLGPDCFLFSVQDLIAFIFFVQGSLCKFFDSQLR
jgi:hypothetical protein